MKRSTIPLILALSWFLAFPCNSLAFESLELPDVNSLSFKNPFLSELPQKSVAKEPKRKISKKAKPSSRAKKIKKPTPNKKISQKKKRTPLPPSKPAVAKPSLKISGIVWNSDRPQAIINGQVAGIGDIVDGSTVINITKESINILYQGEQFTIRYN